MQIFCRKLHENARIWILRGRASLAPPGSANALQLWVDEQGERERLGDDLVNLSFEAEFDEKDELGTNQILALAHAKEEGWRVLQKETELQKRTY